MGYISSGVILMTINFKVAEVPRGEKEARERLNWP